MPKLPIISGKKLLKCFLRTKQYQVYDQHGSHVILQDIKNNQKTTIPVHSNQDLPKGTLKSILVDLNLSIEDILRIIHR